MLAERWQTVKVQGICIMLATIANSLLLAVGCQRFFGQGPIAFLAPVLWGIFCCWPIFWAPLKKRKIMWGIWIAQFILCCLVLIMGTTVAARIE